MTDLPELSTDVLVVGAGPTGLMAGLVLAHRGINAMVIDPKTGPTRESRALAVQARTMEIYHQLGLDQQVLAGAQPATQMKLRPDAPGLDITGAQRGATAFPGIQIFEQSRNEALLASALDSAGSPVRWGDRLVEALPRDDGIDALIEGPQGLGRVRARWCIGADGARSMVRRQLDIPFEGVTDDATFFVADLHGVPGQPDGAMTGRFGDSSFGLTFPLGPGGHARLVALSPGVDSDQETLLAGARDELGVSYTRVDWFSTYRVHHRVASRFRKGNVFLAGDAAHVHSPVGGQGMNTGLQDAHNLANLLADVHQGRRAPAALDNYEAERRPIAVKLVKVTDRAFSLIARRGRFAGLFRQRISGLGAVLGPKLFSSPVGAHLAGLLGQYRVHYHFVPKGSHVPTWAKDRAVGRRLPSVGTNHDALRSFTWQLHTYGGNASRPDIPEWIDGPTDFGADPSGTLAPERLYLIRPDGFVAASVPMGGETELRAALAAHQILR